MSEEKPTLPHGHYWDFREVYPKSLTVFLMRREYPRAVIVAQWSILRSVSAGDQPWDRQALVREAQKALLSTLKPFMASATFGEGYIDGYKDGKEGAKPVFTPPRTRGKRSTGG